MILLETHGARGLDIPDKLRRKFEDELRIMTFTPREVFRSISAFGMCGETVPDALFEYFDNEELYANMDQVVLSQVAFHFDEAGRDLPEVWLEKVESLSIDDWRKAKGPAVALILQGLNAAGESVPAALVSAMNEFAGTGGTVLGTAPLPPEPRVDFGDNNEDDG